MIRATSSCNRRAMSVRDLARLLLRLLGATAFASACACLLASHLIWNWTPSLPLGLYWLSRGPQAPTALSGALIAFPVPADVRDLVRERRYLPPGALLVKRVVATPGDRVCTGGGTLTVNGQSLGAIRTEDTAGRPLPHDEGCGPLPEGSVYVASHYAKSFDSRTFGPVRTSDIRGTVTPLWTF
ncbi:MAG: S26 family signal peptidase [Polyangiaceae bacterium]